jgi:stage V sporulation protein G
MKNLKVTSVQVYPLKNITGKTKAMARVVLEEQLQLTGLRLIDGANGEFVGYPNDPGYKGEDYRQIYYPLSPELREEIDQAVIAKYAEVQGVLATSE